MTDASQLGPRDSWLPAKGSAKGVIVLAHGLNLHPERMDELGLALAVRGFEVFRPAFHGHSVENGDFLRVEAEHWEADARRFHAIAWARATALQVPLYLCAYSFSGLIFQSMSDALPFDRRVYFAPALSTHFWYPAAAAFTKLFPFLTFRSRIPEGYYANLHSSLRSMLAFHQFWNRWLKIVNVGGEDPVSTLIWADPKDELVHGPRLQELAERHPLWQFRALSTDGCTLPKRYHHLVIDSRGLGKKEFARMVEETAKFLA